MGKMPFFQYTSKIQRQQMDAFGGLMRQPGARDGAIWWMQNMTGREYPVMASRRPRLTVTGYTSPSSIFGGERLLVIDGTSIVYDGVTVGTCTAGKKIFAAMGRRILIWPDKLILNENYDISGTVADVQSLPASAEEGEAYRVGTAAPYTVYVYAAGSWQSNGAEVQRVECNGEFNSITLRDGTYQEAAARANTLYAASIVWSQTYSVGDAVEISGLSDPENNKTAIIREIDDTLHEMRFYENVFTLPEGQTEKTYTGTIYIRRRAPELDGICVNENRVWGYKGDTVYASKLGDPKNWNVFDGLSTDSYFVEIGTPGHITGCTSYGGYPVFFKRSGLIKIYGSKPTNFQAMESACIGVAPGEAQSMAVAGQQLFFLSQNGPTVYAGGLPEDAGQALGNLTLHGGIAGSDGEQYYLSALDEAGNAHLLVFDTESGGWWREDGLRAAQFAQVGKNLFVLTASGAIYNLSVEGSETVQSSVEFAPFTEGSMDRKGVSRLQLRLRLEIGASVTVSIRYDDEAAWTDVASVTAAGVTKSWWLPILPRRCDRFRIRITGTGKWRLMNIAREDYVGSPMK